MLVVFDSWRNGPYYLKDLETLSGSSGYQGRSECTAGSTRSSLLSDIMSNLDWTHVPNDAEREALNSLLEERTKDLSDLYKSVDNLKNEIEQLQRYVAPVRRLSPDALGLVFDHCIEVDDRAPWTLASVSRSWRRLLLDSPQM